nr:MAG TPA: Toxin Ibs, type I toxin-antitoxin system [Caudoviricetes sp.]
MKKDIIIILIMLIISIPGIIITLAKLKLALMFLQ